MGQVNPSKPIYLPTHWEHWLWAMFEFNTNLQNRSTL